MKIPYLNRFGAKHFLPAMFFLIGIFVACTCIGQIPTGDSSDVAVVTREIIVQANCSYEDVLEKMNGVDPTTRMFASQDVQVVAYTPRKATSKPPKGVFESTIDVQCCSHEYGKMHYLMHIHGTEESTTIDVGLIHPIDKLVGQYYRYVIQPCGENATQINIYHELHIKIERRRMAFINRIIERVTYKKTNEKIDVLTPCMAARVHQIANHVTESDLDDEATTEDEVKEERVAEKESETNPVKVAEAKENSQPQLKITVTGAAVASGEMLLAIYSSEEQMTQHDSSKPAGEEGTVFRQKGVSVTGENQSSVTFMFDDVPAGTYAVAAFHDVNGNGILDTNGIGLPTERYGFSRNARGMFGPPDYEAAAIQFDASSRSFKFRIK